MFPLLRIWGYGYFGFAKSLPLVHVTQFLNHEYLSSLAGTPKAFRCAPKARCYVGICPRLRSSTRLRLDAPIGAMRRKARKYISFWDTKMRLSAHP